MQYHDKIGKILKYMYLFSYQKNFVGTQNQVQISHSKEPLVFKLLSSTVHSITFICQSHGCMVGWCKGVMYLTLPGRPTDIG